MTPFEERQAAIDRQTFETVKQNKQQEVYNAWLTSENGIINSSVWFAIDATDRANRDLQGLVTAMEASNTETVMFCSADNSFHEVTLAQVKTMQLELIAYAQSLYARKWQLRTAIEAATTMEELDAINIDFSDLQVKQ